jgi:hypothetical protein
LLAYRDDIDCRVDGDAAIDGDNFFDLIVIRIGNIYISKAVYSNVMGPIEAADGVDGGVWENDSVYGKGLFNCAVP